MTSTKKAGYTPGKWAIHPRMVEALRLIVRHFAAKDNESVTRAKNELLRVAPEFAAYFTDAESCLRDAGVIE